MAGAELSAGPIGELVPAIVQDAGDGRVLMLAWMDDEALRRTRESGEAWFWSRSRQEYWHKGATSGNTLAVEEIRDDCDGDAILLRVRPAGPPATPAPSRASRPGCGGGSWSGAGSGRRAHTSSRCSTAVRPLPRARSARKESRSRSPAPAESDERLVEELADLWFHSYVLLAARGLDPARVEDELRRRVR